MKIKIIFLAMFLMASIHSFSQKFTLGDRLNPSINKFKLLGISSSTNVATYKYIGAITDTYFYNRRIGEIIVGIKNGIVVTTIYNLIPENGDYDVPQSTLNLIQNAIGFPLAKTKDFYGANIDDMTITVRRINNVLTFNKDRIMFFTSVKNSILTQ